MLPCSPTTLCSLAARGGGGWQRRVLCRQPPAGAGAAAQGRLPGQRPVWWPGVYAVGCVLYAVCCMLHAAWCMLRGVCCMPYAAWCMVHGEVCMVSDVRVSILPTPLSHHASSLFSPVDGPAPPHTLHQKRRLSIALALLGGPRVVVLDEPSSGLGTVAPHQSPLPPINHLQLTSYHPHPATRLPLGSDLDCISKI
jgi:hypothetical protein